MRFSLFIILIFSLLTACRSSFEQVRLSNDPPLILTESIKFYDKGDYPVSYTHLTLPTSDLV